MDGGEVVASNVRFGAEPWAGTVTLWVSDGAVHCTNAFGDAFEGTEAMTYMRGAADGRAEVN